MVVVEGVRRGEVEGGGCDCESGGGVAVFLQPMQRHRDVHGTPD